MLDEVFPDLQNMFENINANFNYFVERAISTPTNRIMDELNMQIMKILQLRSDKPMREFKSVDYVEGDYNTMM